MNRMRRSQIGDESVVRGVFSDDRRGSSSVFTSNAMSSRRNPNGEEAATPLSLQIFQRWHRRRREHCSSAQTKLISFH
jgi:hypothetical protein